MRQSLHPKIRKNLFDLDHDRYLTKSHTIAQLTIAIWLAFLGSVATYTMQHPNGIDTLIGLFIIAGTSFIFSLGYFFYLETKMKRDEVIDRVRSLNSDAGLL